MQEQRPIVTRRYEDETRRYTEMDVDAFVALFLAMHEELTFVISNSNGMPVDLWKRSVLSKLKHLCMAMKLVS